VSRFLSDTLSSVGRPEADGGAPAIVPDAAEPFRAAMRELTTAVCVVTAGRGRERCGLTASSVTSLSLEPASLMVCIRKESRTLERILDDDAFAVNILAAEQRAIAAEFAAGGPGAGAERFRDSGWTDGHSGVPVLSGSLAAIECRVGQATPWHTHVVIVGFVTAVRLHGPGDPLLYWRGAYRQLGAPRRDR